MVAEAVYLELSSSDEDDEDHIQNFNDSTDSTRLSCLSKVCNDHVEDDDLVIINKPASNDKVKRDKPRVIRSVMDDDECCMLDTDPAAATETAACTPPLDSDELVMTGEKGPVACRDFPHARYLCVHFPFKSTPHTNFCTQCHCYVCDSLAPCSLWGDGTSVNDHCHATEDSAWKTLRKLAKCRPLPSSRATPIPTATAAAAQSALTVSSINSIPTPMGVSRFLPSSTLQAHATTPSPITRSQVIGPISGVSLQVRRDTTTPTGPLVIRLRGNGRGKASQPLHLGVRVPRPPPQRSPPVATFLGNTRSPPVPRPPSAPAPVLPTPAPPPQQQHQFYFNPGAGRAECVTAPYSCQQVPALGTLPGGVELVPPPVNFSQTMGNGAPFYPLPAPPLPNAPAPYIPPPPPPPFAYAPGAYTPPIAAYDQYPMPVHRAGDGYIPQFPDSHYVSPNDQQMNMVQEQHFALPRSSYGMDFGAQEHRNPVVSTDCFATPSYGAGDEAWAAEAASLFDSFTPNQQPATSLEKVLEQMAGDEYLCEPFPCW